MTYDPKIHHRRSIRLKGYDYTLPGAYFITIATWQRANIFGEIVNTEMILSAFGKIAHEEWLKTAKLRPTVVLHEDEFVVMPNHIHGIIWIALPGGRGAPQPSGRVEEFGKPVANSIPTIVRAYKSAVTYHIHRLDGARDVPIWQPNYYEHVIRDQADFQRIWNYIDNNPRCWRDDQLHPNALPNRFNQETS